MSTPRSQPTADRCQPEDIDELGHVNNVSLSALGAGGGDGALASRCGAADGTGLGGGAAQDRLPASGDAGRSDRGPDVGRHGDANQVRPAHGANATGAGPQSRCGAGADGLVPDRRPHGQADGDSAEGAGGVFHSVVGCAVATWRPSNWGRCRLPQAAAPSDEPRPPCGA